MSKNGYTQIVGNQGRFLEYNKFYKTADGFRYQIWNPEKLSGKQWAVVTKFAEAAGLTASLNEVAPWIDLVFKLNRGEMTEARFTAVTKLQINLSASDYRNDHNL